MTFHAGVPQIHDGSSIYLHPILPIILQLFICPFRHWWRPLHPCRVIPYEKIDPYRSGKPHQHRLQEQQQNRIHTHPPKKPVVLERHSNDHLPGYKACHGHRDRQRIAYEARPVIKPYLDLERLTAHRTGIRHLHHLSKVIWISVLEEIAPATTGAFISKDAPDPSGSMIVMVGTHT